MIESEVIGQLAIGQATVSVGSRYGSVLRAAPASAPVIEEKGLPIFRLPAGVAGLVGRENEVSSAIAAIAANQTVEFYGPIGIGKTALLRHLAHHPQVTTCRADGIYYLAQHQPVADFLQTLFELFYTSEPACQPGQTTLRQALQEKQLLILLNDRQLTTQDLNQLLQALPNSTVIIASDARRFWGTGRTIALEGLSERDGVALVAQELKHALTSSEVEAAVLLWRIFKGHPQQLLQAAALAREDNLSLEQVVHPLQEEDAQRSLAHRLLAPLGQAQRWIIAVLMALGGIGLLPEQIAAISGPPNPLPVLTTLLQRRLIQFDGQRYSLSGSLVQVLQADFNATPWMERVLAYLLRWVDEQRRSPTTIVGELEVMLYTLNWAVTEQRWTEVLRLVRSLDSALILTKQWERWGQVLQWGLQAAWALEDQPAEAWALHQLGTRAFCQEDIPTAYDAFSQALKLRTTLNDERGKEVTRHNLSVLKEMSLPASEPSSASSILASTTGVRLSIGLLGLILFGLSGLVGWTIYQALNRPTAEPVPLVSPDRLR